MRPKATHCATYRVQFQGSFGFGDAREMVSYLSELGISHIYASPILACREGSAHGYDVVDPTRINPELGGIEALRPLREELERRGMGWIQDMVPNHMAAHPQNPMAVDVWEEGRSSRFSRYFDIQWDHPYPGLNGKWLAPFLGRGFGECLERGEIQLGLDPGGFFVRYWEWRFPLCIESYATLLTHRLGELRGKLDPEHGDLIRLLGLLYVIKNLPPVTEDTERQEQITFIKRGLWELHQGNPIVRGWLQGTLEDFNGQPGRPASFSLLEDLLSRQFYRLSYWKVATEEINYRRFFNINELISLRIEDPDVFNYVHGLLFELVDEGLVDGLRVDHIDGLYDPTGYLHRVRQRAPDIYLVVEKILHPQEDLPEEWPVQGTTGYDFLNILNGLFCRGRSGRAFSRIYREFVGDAAVEFDALLVEKKRLIIEKHMAGDIDNLAHLLKDISARDRFGVDVTLHGIKRALVEVMAHFPVYRGYISPAMVRQEDLGHMRRALDAARRANPSLEVELNYLGRSLLLDFPEYLSPQERDHWLHFVMRFQQFTGPIMAKGFEDTVLYVYNRLLSLNEVGGWPSAFGTSVKEFHRFMKRRAVRWPHSMNATSTHDTKRGEDVRARINVLSEVPSRWEQSLKRWSRVNRRHKSLVDGRWAPDRNDEWLLYQTLLGTWPFEEGEVPSLVERLRGYLVKAVREAKVHTAWLKPDEQYEEAFVRFMERILDPRSGREFLEDFLPFQKDIAFYGTFNSLSQVLLKMTAPGIPDFYQGSELWEFHLVDPDNRRPVDFSMRARHLEGIRTVARGDPAGLLHDLLSHMEDGRVKLFLIWRVLQARREHPILFLEGDYLPLRTEGPFKDNIVAFARRFQGMWAMVVAPRFLTGVIDPPEMPLGERVWRDTSVILPPKAPRLWRDFIACRPLSFQRKVQAGELMHSFPVAFLLSEEGP